MRNTSLKLKHISENTSKLVTAILLNQDLLKYIYYLDNAVHPLDKSNADVSWLKVRDSNFIFAHFNEEILTDKKILVFFNPMTSDFRNPTLSKDIYSLSVAIPHRYWVIGNNSGFELRGWSIMREIAKTIDQKNIAGIGDVLMTNVQAGKLNNSFSIISCSIETTNASVKGFGE